MAVGRWVCRCTLSKLLRGWATVATMLVPMAGCLRLFPISDCQICWVMQVYQIKPLRAWGAVITTLASMAGCLWLIAQAPWYMLPFAWALAGTAFTGVRNTAPCFGRCKFCLHVADSNRRLGLHVSNVKASLLVVPQAQRARMLVVGNAWSCCQCASRV